MEPLGLGLVAALFGDAGELAEILRAQPDGRGDPAAADRDQLGISAGESATRLGGVAVRRRTVPRSCSAWPSRIWALSSGRSPSGPRSRLAPGDSALSRPAVGRSMTSAALPIDVIVGTGGGIGRSSSASAAAARPWLSRCIAR